MIQTNSKKEFLQFWGLVTIFLAFTQGLWVAWALKDLGLLKGSIVIVHWLMIDFSLISILLLRRETPHANVITFDEGADTLAILCVLGFISWNIMKSDFLAGFILWVFVISLVFGVFCLQLYKHIRHRGLKTTRKSKEDIPVSPVSQPIEGSPALVSDGEIIHLSPEEHQQILSSREKAD